MKKILFIISEDSYFLSHRLNLVKAAQSEGYEVGLLCNFSRHKKTLDEMNIETFDWDINRSSFNPLKELKSFFQIYTVLKSYKADIVHTVSLKPVVYSGLISRLFIPSNHTFALGGLGYVFNSPKLKAKILKILISKLLSYIFRAQNSLLIIQNIDDCNSLLDLNIIDPQKIRLVRGAGVNTSLYSPTEVEKELDNIPLVILPSRLLWDKGIREFVDSAKILKDKGIQARFAVVGDQDDLNPECVDLSQIEAWKSKGYVEFWGFRDDMPNIYKMASIVCLPSYREGLPKSLLEAASCGIPLVAFDVPGCREIVIEGVNGFLVPEVNAELLSKSLEELIEDRIKRRVMGKAGRKLVLKEFSDDIVINKTKDVWKEVLL